MESLKLGTWNVRGIFIKEEELGKEIQTMKVKITVLTETEKKIKGTEQIGIYTFVYSWFSLKQRADKVVAKLITNGQGKLNTIFLSKNEYYKDHLRYSEDT